MNSRICDRGGEFLIKNFFHCCTEKINEPINMRIKNFLNVKDLKLNKNYLFSKIQKPKNHTEMNEILQFFGYFNFGNSGNNANNNSTENNKRLPLIDAKKQANSHADDANEGAKRKRLNKAELLAERKRMIG